jgi:hypothetical protein
MILGLVGDIAERVAEAVRISPPSSKRSALRNAGTPEQDFADMPELDSCG